MSVTAEWPIPLADCLRVERHGELAVISETFWS